MHFTSSRHDNQHFANPFARDVLERREGREGVSEMGEENSSYHFK
jgi:hypothetical protein